MRKFGYAGKLGSEDPFIFKVDTTNNTAPGGFTASATNQFEIPIAGATSQSGYELSFEVDWGDGTTSHINSSNYTTACLHTYSSPGIYTIKCRGSVACWTFYPLNTSSGRFGDMRKLIEISQWGAFRMDGGPTSYNGGLCFAGCNNLTQITCPDVPVMGDINNPALFGSRTFRGLFSSCVALERINRIADWPINGRISASGFMFMFEGCSNLRYGDLGTGIINLSSWDVGNNVNYMRMFNGCTLFNGRVFVVNPNNTASNLRLEDMFKNCSNFDGSNSTTVLQAWNTGVATRMDGMFQGCIKFDVDISGWDTKAVTTMEQMFDVGTSGGTFDQPIGGWNVATVTNMCGMLTGQVNFNQDLSNWNVNSWSTASGAGVPPIVSSTFANFQLSTANYDALLVAWDNYTFPSWPGGTVDFGNSTYSLGSSAATARASLVTKWGAILDGGGV
jgi:surface protein